MCTQRLEGSSRETLGQRLLKEPIWIGLLVILSVIMLFGVVYILRRRCGTYFGCCEVSRTKDDNILNANGTITLNSFPLKSLTRPSISIISLPSPVLPRGVYLKNDTPSSTPGVNIWNAAAKFFASYRDTERSLIASPLTTDFTKTTDTSLSQVIGDASVGAVVGGKLQLDLHIRENKERAAIKEREAMSRTTSVVHIPDSPLLTMKHVCNGETFIERQDKTFETCSCCSSHSLNEEEQTISSALEHIYPYVIVQSPQTEKFIKYDVSYEKERSNADIAETGCVNSTGAHVIPVNLEEQCDDTDGFHMSKSHTESSCNGLPVWNLYSHSADYMHQLEQAHDDGVHRKIDRYRDTIDKTVRAGRDNIDRAVRGGRRNTDRAVRGGRHKTTKQSNVAKMVVENDLPSSSALHKRHAYGTVVRNRSTPSFVNGDRCGDRCGYRCDGRCGYRCDGRCGYRCDGRCGYRCDGRCDDKCGDNWGHPFRTDPYNSIPHDRHAGKTVRLNSNCEELTHNKLHPPYIASINIRHGDYYTCDCTLCSLHRSNSMTSTVSSASRNARPCREIIGNRTYKHKHRPKRVNYIRSVSTNSEHSTIISRRKPKKGSSFNLKHKYSKPKQSLPGSSLSSIQEKFNSSADSDFIKTKRKTYKCKTQKDIQCGEKQLGASLYTRDNFTTLSQAQDQVVPTPDTDIKDLFQKVFSQEIDLDDFSLPGEDDTDFVLRTKSTSKESFLASEQSCVYSSENDDKNETNKVVEPTTDCATMMKINDSQPHYLSVNMHRNSVVTMLAGRSERISVSKSASVDVHQESDGMTSNGFCVTPTTCNVILYHTNRSLDNHDTPSTIKSHFQLVRKHSSLDLVEPLRLLHTNQQSLLTTSSMQELSNQAETQHEISVNAMSANKLGPVNCRNKRSILQDLHGTSNRTIYMPHTNSNKMNDTDDNLLRNDWSNTKNMNAVNHFTSISPSSDTLSPQTLRKHMDPNYSNVSFGCRQYLCVTDTDSAMSSAASPQGKRSKCHKSRSLHPVYREDPMVKDSAYQTKQSSVERDNNVDTRGWRPMTPLREENARVTQRLRQAALKLLVIQQRFRQARQNLSKDSAVHTISEDDNTMDDIRVTSDETRTQKPVVVYSGKEQSEHRINAFPPKIVDKQNTVFEYEL